MSSYCGKEATIIDIYPQDSYPQEVYKIDIDNLDPNNWTDEMFENRIFDQLEIGETCNYAGHTLKIIKGDDTCPRDCFFKKSALCTILNCAQKSRTDNNPIYFKEVESDMEERNIKIDIDTAKKWYNGEDKSLKEIALQAYNEDELTETKVKVWDDLLKLKEVRRGYFICSDSNISDPSTILSLVDKNLFIDKKHAKSALAMAQISQLMHYYGGRITDKEWNEYSNKFIIYKFKNELISSEHIKYSYYFLAFHTSEQRDEFLKNNEQLVKDYLMID
jgi:hypothetical protein